MYICMTSTEKSIPNHKQYLSLKVELQGTFKFYLTLALFEYLQGVGLIILSLNIISRHNS